MWGFESPLAHEEDPNRAAEMPLVSFSADASGCRFRSFRFWQSYRYWCSAKYSWLSAFDVAFVQSELARPIAADSPYAQSLVLAVVLK